MIKQSGIIFSTFVITIFFIAPTFISYVFAQSNLDKDKIAVTYIANEGFLVEMQNHKVMFDALFGGINGNWCEQPSDSINNLMMNGITPFDNIDVIFVTHKHIDHFDPTLVVNFLMSHPGTKLVCPLQATEMIKENSDYKNIQSKIVSLDCTPYYDTLLSINKINIRAMRFNHGSYFETDTTTGELFDRHKNVDNMCYLVEVGGINVFHTGDCSTSDTTHFHNYNIKKLEIDIALFDKTFFKREGQELINKYIKSGNIIFMHIEPGRADFYSSIIKDVPQMYILKNSLETKIYRKGT